MAAQQQKTRASFLVVLTVVVAVFGASRFWRTYHQTRRQEDYVQTELQLREYMSGILRAPQEELEDFALAEHGRIRRDAAALLMQARCLLEGSRDRGGAPPPMRAVAALKQIKANFDRLRAGKDLNFPRGQSFVRGYYAAVDGSFQPYAICVPDGYRQERPSPLIVTLAGPEDGLQARCPEAPRYQGAISVRPTGRGGRDCVGIGEDGVLSALEDVCSLYEIDKGRIYLVGSSEGAAAGYCLAGHYPHIFAGIVALGGDGGRDVSAACADTPGGAEETPADLRAFLRARTSPVSYAENLGHTRLVAARGSGGAVLQADLSRAMVQRLRQLNYPLEYLEFPQAAGGLPDWVEQYAIAKVFGAAPPGPWTTFRYKTAHLRHNRAWWTRLDRLDSPVGFSTVAARAADGRVEIGTDNVSALTVLLAQLPVEARVVSVDGTEFTLPQGYARPEFSLEKAAGQWQVAGTSDRLKRRGHSGPFSDIFRDPFMVVYGTTGDSEMLKAISRREAQRFAADWQARYGSPPRVKSDAEVTREDIAELNLMIFGGPEVNAIAHEIALKLPIRADGGAVVIDDETFRGDDTGMLVCYPNPLNSRRMIGLVAGTTPGALHQAYARTGMWFGRGRRDACHWFDYVVFDNRSVGLETFLTVGFFDNEWRPPRKEGAAVGGGWARKADPDAAAELLPQGRPEWEHAGEADAQQVALSDVLPTKIEQDGAVGIDRTCDGGPIRFGDEVFEKGLAVAVPSAVSFDLGGQFSWFAATVGLAERAEGQAALSETESDAVIFEVWGDGRLLDSAGPLGRQEGSPRSSGVRADVRQIDRVTLKARPAEGGAALCVSGAWADPTVGR